MFIFICHAFWTSKAHDMDGQSLVLQKWPVAQWWRISSPRPRPSEGEVLVSQPRPIKWVIWQSWSFYGHFMRSIYHPGWAIKIGRKCMYQCPSKNDKIGVFDKCQTTFKNDLMKRKQKTQREDTSGHIQGIQLCGPQHRQHQLVMQWTNTSQGFALLVGQTYNRLKRTHR